MATQATKTNQARKTNTNLPTDSPQMGSGKAAPSNRASQNEPPSEERAGKKSVQAEAADVAKETKQQAAEQASAAKDQALQRGCEFADGQKHYAAGELETFGAAVRQAAQKLGEDGQDGVACYAEACADECERAAGYLQNSDFKQIYRDVNGFARRRPEMFLGGMFVAGLALSRLLKASSDEAHGGADGDAHRREPHAASLASTSQVQPAAPSGANPPATKKS